MNLRVRIQKLQRRYGYENPKVIFSQEVVNPSNVEQYAHKLLKDERVSAVTNGDSNEWFKASHKSAISAIKKAIQLVS